MATALSSDEMNLQRQGIRCWFCCGQTPANDTSAVLRGGRTFGLVLTGAARWESSGPRPAASCGVQPSPSGSHKWRGTPQRREPKCRVDRGVSGGTDDLADKAAEDPGQARP
jgi:hypothetical protein